MGSPSTERILIVGAGELGTAMLEGLTRHARYASSSSPSSRPSIAVLLRPATIDSADGEKVKANAHLRSLGASLVAGDIVRDSEERLAGIFGCFDAVVVCSGFGFPAGTRGWSA